MLTDWLEALHHWEIAALVRRSLYVYPIVNATHIFSLTLLIGAILPADLRLLGLFGSVPAAPFLRVLSAVSGTGLVLAVASGFLLFSVQPLEYAGNPAFLTKISLVAAGTILALTVRFSGPWRDFLADGRVTLGLRVAAVASIGIWLSALLFGRWIAFL